MVERTLGKGEVGSSILPSSTIFQWDTADRALAHEKSMENCVLNLAASSGEPLRTSAIESVSQRFECPGSSGYQVRVGRR